MKHQLLSAMGIQTWHVVSHKHPAIKGNINICFDRYLINASLLAILPIKAHLNKDKKQKMIEMAYGMLKVVANENIILATLYLADNEELTNIESELNKYLYELQPSNVLIFGNEPQLNIIEAKYNIYNTFHPDHLISNPQDKKTAYKNLLQIQNSINI